MTLSPNFEDDRYEEKRILHFLGSCSKPGKSAAMATGHVFWHKRAWAMALFDEFPGSLSFWIKTASIPKVFSHLKRTVHRKSNL